MASVNKPSFKTLKATAEKFEIELPKGTIKVACDSILTHFKENFDPETLVECPVCKFDAPEFDAEGNTLTACPYCDTPFTDAPPEEKPATPPKKASSKKGAAAKNEAEPPKEEKHIVTPEQQKELDEALEAIQGLQTDRAKKTHDIGVWLAKISDDNLWKGMLIAATDKDGKAIERPYKNFFELIKDKLDISRSGAYKYMLCARNFTKEQFLQVGVKKGELIASAPDRHREALMNAAVVEGASHTELRNQLAKLEGKGGNSGGTPKVTLSSRTKDGDIAVPWLSADTHEPVVRGNAKKKYAKLDLTDDYELIIVNDENGLGATINVRKIEKEPEAPAATE